MNSLSFCLTEKSLSTFIFEMYFGDLYVFSSFSTLNLLLHCLLACIDFHCKILISGPVYVMCPFYLSAFNTFFLVLVFCSVFVFQ